MTKQLIIAIGREYGTGGHDIAKELAARFGIQYYDRNILDEIAEEKNIEVKNLETYDERPKRVNCAGIQQFSGTGDRRNAV